MALSPLKITTGEVMMCLALKSDAHLMRATSSGEARHKPPPPRQARPEVTRPNLPAGRLLQRPLRSLRKSQR